VSQTATLVWSDYEVSLEPAQEIVVAIGGQGASRHTLDHLFRGRHTLLLVETDDAPNIGLPAGQIQSIARTVERVLEEQYTRTRVRQRAVFVGQSKGVAVGRALANSRPDLFKGGIGIGGACRNLRDLKPESKTLLEFIARSQLLASGEGAAILDEAAMQDEWSEMAELAGSPLHQDQLYVSIYLDQDGDEAFKQTNCMSVDPHHLNLAVPLPEVQSLAHVMTTGLSDLLGLPPTSPAARLFYDGMLASPMGAFWLGATLEMLRTWRVWAPRTTLRQGRLVITGWQLQRIPINHGLVGFTHGAVAAARQGLDRLRDFPD
jgi:hypothetical protein